MKASPEQTLEDSPPRAPWRQLAGNRREQPTDDATAEAVERLDSERYDPRRWGLSATAVTALAERLYEFWQRFRTCCKTRTRDPVEQAYDYLRGQLTMDSKRHVANMARTTTGDDGQALQHFMSNSPWSGPGVFPQMQAESTATPALGQGGTLILDESADEKAGTHTAGAARQYNGRMGKVDLCRVDTCLTYANPTVGLWTIVDGELFLPAEWFGEERAAHAAADPESSAAPRGASPGPASPDHVAAYPGPPHGTRAAGGRRCRPVGLDRGRGSAAPCRMVGDPPRSRGGLLVYAAQCPSGHGARTRDRVELPPLLHRAHL